MRRTKRLCLAPVGDAGSPLYLLPTTYEQFNRLDPNNTVYGYIPQALLKETTKKI
ncbi:MAG: hypothetical protein AAGE84_25175 [Cyanobacteria bacterium P01_G01_bin.39]